MKATDNLRQDHKLILRALNLVEQMAANVERGKPLDKGDAECLVDFLRTFADGHHKNKEERVFFPALREAAIPNQRSLLGHMLFEHAQERALLLAVEKSIVGASTEEFVTQALRFVQAARVHIFKEDHILFETSDQLLGVIQNDTLAVELQSFDLNRNESEMLDRLVKLRVLEWKLLGRAASA